TQRQGETYFKLLTAALFYKLFRRLAAIDVPINTGDFRLMDRKVVDQLKQMKERARFIRGMVSWGGFKQCSIGYVRDKRFAGETKYPFRKMLTFALDGILAFSKTPLQLASALGFICAMLSLLFILYGLSIKLFYPQRAIPGWASLFTGVLFLGG